MKKILILILTLFLVWCVASEENKNTNPVLDTESTSWGWYGEPTTQEGTR